MTGRGRRLAISGLGRFGGGGGLARDSEHHHHVVHLGLGRASWQGAQGHYPHHFDGLSARPGAPVSRRSPRIRANRVPRAGFLGVGRASWSTRASTSRSAPDTSPSCRPSVEAGHDDQLGTLGRGRTRPPAGRPSVEAGHVHQGDDDIPAWVQVASGHVAPVWERLWERRLELGGNGYKVLVPRASTNLDKIFDQALILWCGMVPCGRAEIPVLGRDMGALGSSSLQPPEPMEARGVSSAAPKVAW